MLASRLMKSVARGGLSARVSLGVGESVVARMTIDRNMRIGRIRLVADASRLSRLLGASDLEHLEVTSIKIAGEEQLTEPIAGKDFAIREHNRVPLPFMGPNALLAAKPGDTITVTIRDRGKSERGIRRTVRRALLHRQAVVVVLDGADQSRPFLFGVTATPSRADGRPIPVSLKLTN